MSLMKAYTIDRYKQKQLNLRKIERPLIKKDEVLVKIMAASLNPVDYKVRDGKLKVLLNYQMPLILGNDFSGIVVEKGEAVTEFDIGDAVYGRPAKNKTGTFAEYLAINSNDIAKMPNNLTFEEAASIPLVGLTSYQALKEIIGVKKGDKVLIHAGSGGVGTFAIQLAKVFGAEVSTTVSDKGKALVQSLGADHIINYREEDFTKGYNQFAGVFDTLGGETTYQSFQVVRPGGTVVSVSALPTDKTAQSLNLNLGKFLLLRLISSKLRRSAKHHNAKYEFLFMRPSGKQLKEISTYIEEGKIKPVIDEIFDFEQLNEAMAKLESGRAKGKIILKVGLS